MTLKRIIAIVLVLGLLAAGGASFAWISIANSLPQMIKVEDYKPLLVSEVYARGGEKIGEFSRENRVLIPYEKIPKHVIHAFLAAEDDTFFEHGGINYLAIMRAMFANLRTGRKSQGASTITQQVARSLLLSSEKTYVRKIKEILLSYRMEENLKKEEILYLYLNQIYFGEGAYGIGAAADTYFRKTIDQLTLPEAAILAGLPQAPSAYSPTKHPQRAKERQKYVLKRMAAVNFINEDEAQKAINEPITVYLGKEYKAVAPFFVETLRQILVQQIGEKVLLDEGLKIHTSIDFKAQQEAQNQIRNGLRELDKRQGYRGPLKNIPSPQERDQFLLATRKKLENEKAPVRVILPEGNLKPERPLELFHKRDAQGRIVSNIPEYISKGQIVDAIVTKVDDALGLVAVRFAESFGLMDVADMGWARKPDPAVNADYAPRITKPSQVVKPGDVIQVKVVAEKFISTRLSKPPPKPKKGQAPPPSPPKGLNFEAFAHVTLEQQPLAEASLISFDQKTGEILAMVGGFEFKKNENEFNRAIQAKRQTGSAFKTIVYASALDKGFTAATPIQDSPIVFEGKSVEETEGQQEAETKTWKPHNHGQKFVGDILFRNALIRSLNIPTVKILEAVGVPWVVDYARRLGVFSALNQDLSLGLGSSSLTLYEMTKVFSQFGRLGQRIRPLMVHKVIDQRGKDLLEELSLDKRFEREIGELEKQYEEKRQTAITTLAATTATATAPQQVQGQAQGPGEAGSVEHKIPKVPQIYFQDPDQLISPQTAYVITTLLSGVINDEGGTAGRARALGRPAAGKTGSTNGYFDAWFIGYTPQIATGVWVGFDEEKSLGPGEVGGRAALPIWLEYMKTVHKDLPVMSFPVPQGIVFANIDNQTGQLASASSTSVVNQAFIQGTEPKELSGAPSSKDDTDFYKEDLTE